MSSQAIVAFVPVLHQGYINFFKKYPEAQICILGADFQQDFTSIVRDLRVMDPELVKTAIDSLSTTIGISKDVIIVTKDTIGKIGEETVIMPDEDVSHAVAEQYLAGKKVEFVSTFLRWDKQISTTEMIVPPDRTISEGDADRELMAEAIKTGRRSADWWRQVGALAVKDGKILYSAFNEHLPNQHMLGTYGDPRSNFDAGVCIDLVSAIHAEANIIAAAARDGRSLEGTDFFVSTFPCPTCARLIMRAGAKRVFYNKGYSLLDAEQILKGAGIEIVLVKEA